MTPTSRLKTSTIAILACCLVFETNPALAACGGGGVGGAKVSGSAPTKTQEQNVPWKVLGPKDQRPPRGTLTLYWFPPTPEGAKTSGLLTSRTLTLFSARCVTMVQVTPDNADLRVKFDIPSPGAGVVLEDERGEEVGRVVDNGTPIEADPVERLVKGELDKRELEAKNVLAAADEKIKANELETATTLLNTIWAKRCIVPDVAKKAAKALEKLGHPVEVSELPKSPDAAAHR